MTRRQTIRESIKKEVSYRQQYKCAICSNLLPPSFQIDHIIPWSISRDDSEENLQALCPNCHSLKTQKEIMRISQYKKIQSECPAHYHLCWFCVETYNDKSTHLCDKSLKDIPRLVKTQSELLTSFEDMLDKYKYVKRSVQDVKDINNILKIKINLCSSTIYVNQTIVKFSNNDLCVDDIVEAVFLATRTKKDSKRYSTIHITIDTDDEEGREQCLEFIESKDVISKFPERIFNSADIDVIYF